MLGAIPNVRNRVLGTMTSSGSYSIFQPAKFDFFKTETDFRLTVSVAQIQKFAGQNLFLFFWSGSVFPIQN